MRADSPPSAPPAKPHELAFHVDGARVEAGARSLMDCRSPAHGVLVTRVPECGADDVDAAVDSARRAFDDGRWSRVPSAERARVLLDAAALIREREAEIAYRETLETGKPITQARGEVGACASLFEHAAGVARTLHGDSFNNLGDALFGLVTREPIGVVGVITPWNFPFLILSERVPYILGAGCTVVAKPSEFTSTTTVMMAELLAEAGLPPGCMNVVTGPGETVGQAILEHDRVDMVSFTGSTRVGRRCVAAAAGNLKKLALELGGKNPQIVFADAALDDAADGVAFGVAFNAGQCCVSGSRLIVERAVAEDFAARVAERLGRARVGDPLDPDTQIGAITTEAQYRRILDHIEGAKAGGARLLCGGGPIERDGGRFVAPTLFADVAPEAPIGREEVFGPVLTITPFDTAEEAIELANDTEYGLAASLWTRDVDKALSVTRRVQAGRFWVNTTLAGGPELPIGGFKRSGWGRETGRYGMEEYTQLKSVHVALGPRERWSGE